MSVQSENVLDKHHLATKTFYADLSFLDAGVTAVSATATTEDADLTVEGADVISKEIVVGATDDCAGTTLEIGRGILILLSGGVASDDEVIVTVVFELSDGDTDARELRLIVG